MLVHLHSQLNSQVLFKLLAALKLIEDQFIVLCRAHKIVELFLVLLEALVHLPDLGLALDYVNELARIDLILHALEIGPNLVLFVHHYFLLSLQFFNQLLFLILLLAKANPELLFQFLECFMGQLEKLTRGHSFFLVQVASKLQLLLDMADAVVNVVHYLLDLLNFLLRKVLEHLDLMIFVLVKALSAEGHTVVQAEVYVVALVFGADIAIAFNLFG